jgi:hypothetical protein
MENINVFVSICRCDQNGFDTYEEIAAMMTKSLPGLGNSDEDEEIAIRTRRFGQFTRFWGAKTHCAVPWLFTSIQKNLGAEN